MTGHRRRLHELTPEEWRRIDAELDQLIRMTPTERASRLDEVQKERPGEVRLLRHLLNHEMHDEIVDAALLSALGYLAGQDTLSAGTRIGPWSLVRPIGRGGMGEVYLAERADGAFERSVALKLLWPGLISDRAGERVRQERQILANLTDPRIAGLVDGGLTDDGRPWLAMEYVKGRPITEDCRLSGLDLTTRLRRFVEVTEAVATAHRQLVVHGDIKPANVLVTDSGQVKLLDFSIASLFDDRSKDPASTKHWNALTPAWASPEQKRGDPLTPSSDIYQLGKLLGSLLDDLPKVSKRRRRELNAIRSRALAADPRTRYLSADQLAADVEALLTHRPVRAVRGGALYRSRCFLRRRWPAVAAAAVLLATGAAVLNVQVEQSRLLADQNEANEAVLGFLEDMLNQGNPRLAGTEDRLSGRVLEEVAAELNEGQLAGQPRARIKILNTLGRIHLQRNEVTLAVERHGEAIELARRHDWPDAIEASLDGLSTAGIWGGDYAQSEAHLRELLSMRERHADARTVDETRLKLADLLHSRGNYMAAEQLARQAHLNAQHPIGSGRVLGMVLRDQGRFEAAQDALTASLESARLATPSNPATIAELLDHQTVLALHRGQYDRARQALDESQRQRARFLGEHWEGLLWPRHWRALLALAEGRLDSAAELLDIMLVDYARFLGETSHLLAFGRSDRGYVALSAGDRATAAPLFAAAIQRLDQMQSGDHPRLAEPLLGQAIVELAAGRTAEARSLADRALTIRRALPESSEGAVVWRANACGILRLAGGSCALPTGIRRDQAGLDSARLKRALEGVCANHAGRPQADSLCPPVIFR